MLVALILVSIGFAVTLGILLFGGSNRAALPSSASSSSSGRNELESETQRRAKAEAELQRKQKELDEQRAQLKDVKDELKQTKRKLFEQKESEKGPQDLAKARAEVERAASLQLEQTREELSNVLTENQRLRSELESRGRRPQPAPVTAPVTVVAAAPAPAQQISAPAKEGEHVVATTVAVTPVADAAQQDRGQRRYRELNDADREKMERLEQLANKERSRAVELEKELRRVKGRTETQQRVYAATKNDLDLMRDKYKALEKRLNRTLLERDLLRRAIKDLEKKTGMLADRTELTPEEMAASDQRTEETSRVRAETEAQSAAQQAPVAAAEPTASEPSATEPTTPGDSEQKPAPV
ncbi:coiled-coil domain-containing protein [Pyxidicoccus xibeiensis]|uniref:cell envelope biogenesis protein TolA n=1 Tax=Pyxidicoccus xibeiensis TaxID=2906759 RepID=UPI0020A793E1|nr:cell envelope biogenesis protein TolA [Pyxidicoccus xibeiensis]MCP3140790.1 cell envelope biogenesis protein TolA [Pyxidicoccus xibeiensis]